MLKHLRYAVSMAVATALLSSLLVSPAAASVKTMDAVSLAERYIGKDYETGGATPDDGFNSSGLIYYIYNRVLDYEVPRGLRDQFNMSATTIETRSNLKYGDVLYFGDNDQPAFAGIYIGSGDFVMANYTHDKVMKRSLNESYYERRFIQAKRVLSLADHARAKAMVEANNHLGTPYLFGAKKGQTDTFDCSSYVKHIFKQLDIYLPRVSKDQAKYGEYVSRSNLQVGDLVFFTTPRTGDEIGHVGMYAGNGQMIHTYGEGGVKYTALDKPYWKKRYVTARRMIQE